MTTQAIIAAAAHRLAADLLDKCEAPLAPCMVELPVLGVRVVVAITTDKGNAAPANSPNPPHKIKPSEQRVLNVLDGQPPRKGEWIASKLQCVYGGGFRARLSSMLRLGLIARGTDGWGYCLPSPLNV